MEPAIAQANDQANVQLLTFVLAEETFGADINQVQEVLEFSKITRVPKMPDHVIGVINLRGKVVPVVDLHRQFDISPTERTVDTCIVIIEVIINQEPTALGLIADAVKEVIVLEHNNINTPPKIGTTIDTQFIRGMGKYNEEFVIILDLVKLFCAETLDSIKDVSEEDMGEAVSVGSGHE